jgi:hypothetical protein
VAGKIGLDRAEVCFPFKFLRTWNVLVQELMSFVGFGVLEDR